MSTVYFNNKFDQKFSQIESTLTWPQWVKSIVAKELDKQVSEKQKINKEVQA